jgi:hypothetical protein
MHTQATEYSQKRTIMGSEEWHKLSSVDMGYCDPREEVKSAGGCPLRAEESAHDEGFWVVMVVVDDGVD